MSLPADAIARAAEQVESISAMGFFQHFKLPHQFLFTTLGERRFDRLAQSANVHWFRQAVMRPPGSLQRLQLLMHFQRSRNDHYRRKGHEFLEAWQKIQPK